MRMPWRLGVAVVVAAFVGACSQAAPTNSAVSNAAPPPAAAANQAPANAMPAPAIASGPEADAAEAFLTGLYAHYRSESDFQMFGRDEKAVFDADTIKLLAADTKALKGDLGEIDGDWLCNCQDYNSIVATVTVQSATAATAEATSDYHDTGDASRPPDHDTFDLVMTPAGWRIHDLTVRGQGPSLRATLTKEISDLARGAKPNSGE
jgi:hypothetical protein